MKLQVTVVIRGDMTWKDVRSALIRTTNELKFYGDDKPEPYWNGRSNKGSLYDGPGEDASRVGKWELVPDEDED